ncbi:MAG: SDR family NAD(P)-dependent oxidoreductase [Nitrospirae bacterium]|nr:SDR family NAD(P)-dependent oxidoreductase [Nitrospirota bacterium]
MNIFITGATGFIGKNFMEQLYPAMGADDRCFVLVRKKALFDDSRITQLNGSLEEITKFKDEILQCEYFFHIAANPVFGSDINYDKVNYDPTVQIVDLLKKSSSLRNFIFVSTIGAVDRSKGDDCSNPMTVKSSPNPRSLYGESKLKSEKYIKKSGIPHTIIRPTWVYGKNMRADSHINKFVSMVYENSPVSRVGFPGKVSLIHTDDLCRAFVRCINNDRVINKIYFAETEALSIGNIFNIIYSRIRNRKPGQISMPALHFLFKRIHHRLPVTVSNLFLDYLYAEDADFRKDFQIDGVRRLIDGADEIISTNIHNGYWVITGANSGIGLELARKLNALNKKLILIDKDTNNLDSFKNQTVLRADLGRYGEIERLADNVKQYKIFCLVNNAGVGFRGSLREIDLEKIRKTVDVNIFYPVIFTKLMLDALIENRSVIVNVASSVAYNPLPGMSLYSASKAFLANWSEALSYELRKTNKVITFSPSGTFTNFQKGAGVKVVNEGKGLLTPEYVAHRLLKAIDKKRSVVILGVKTKLLLFFAGCLPREINIKLWGKLFSRMR